MKGVARPARALDGGAPLADAGPRSPFIRVAGKKGNAMDVRELLDKARDVLDVKRVYGEPYQADGVTVIPAARVRGGGGGGEGEGESSDREGRNGGSGGGFGLTASPVGVFVIRDGKVRWQPAVDVNRVVLGGQITAIVALLTLQSVLRRRGRPARSR